MPSDLWSVQFDRYAPNNDNDDDNIDCMPFCQILCLAEQVQFTERCEAAIRSNTLQEFQIEMESQLESYTNTEIGGGDSPESHVLELKLKALILDTIHSIDVVQQLIKHGIKSLDEWIWQKQLRFYMQKRESQN